MPKTFFSEVETLTREMVSLPSIVNTDGEASLAKWIHDELAGWDYFRQNPDYLQLLPTLKDNVERYNVIALVKGKKASNTDTVIMMGHIDTVSIDEYGELMPDAYYPDKLAKALQQLSLSDEVQSDLASDQWMFGRGTADMKTGVAAQICVLRRFAQNNAKLNGNLVLLAAPDEEDMSHGALSSLIQLTELAQREELNYIVAINSDYTNARFPNDKGAYIYLGTAGKLLPSFYVAGQETHVGSCFEGFDPNLVTSELTRLIDFNPELCERNFGEVTVPPISLKQADLKNSYDVQTPLAAYAYYNFFTHQRGPEDVLRLMVEKGQQAINNVLEYLTLSSARYSVLVQKPVRMPPWQPEVVSYRDFFKRVAEERGEAFIEAINSAAKEFLQDANLDLRLYSVKMIETVWKWSLSKHPTVIVYFSSAYYPRVALEPNRPEVKRILQALKGAIIKAQSTTERTILVRHYYPYISDMSFFGDSDYSGLDVLAANMPGYGNKYELDSAFLKKFSIPVINIGPFGADAHRFTERVYKPFSFETLPCLLEATIQRLLGSRKKST